MHRRNLTANDFYYLFANKLIWLLYFTGREHNFIKYESDVVNDFGVPYDYDSVMHYPAIAFSIDKHNGLKTIIPVKVT